MFTKIWLVRVFGCSRFGKSLQNILWTKWKLKKDKSRNKSITTTKTSAYSINVRRLQIGENELLCWLLAITAVFAHKGGQNVASFVFCQMRNSRKWDGVMILSPRQQERMLKVHSLKTGVTCSSFATLGVL